MYSYNFSHIPQTNAGQPLRRSTSIAMIAEEDEVSATDKVVFNMDEPMMDLNVDTIGDDHGGNCEMSGDHMDGAFGGGGGGVHSVGNIEANAVALAEHFNENNITDADVERFIEKNGGWADVQPEQYGAVKRYMVRMAKKNRTTEGLRFSDFYESYWAGPAYWKFKKASLAQPRLVGQRPKTARSKKSSENEKRIEYMDVKTLKFVPIDYKLKELNPQSVYAGNVLMPRNYQIDKSVFMNLTHTPWMSIHDWGKELQTTATDSDAQGGGGAAGADLSWQQSQQHHSRSDYDDHDPMPDAGHDEMEQADHLNVSHLSANLDGAPIKSDVIILPYSKINKNIDMHELKVCSKEVIEEHGRRKVAGAKLTLTDLFRDLRPKLSKENADNLSLAITFSALLHVAHENSLRLRSTADFKDAIVE